MKTPQVKTPNAATPAGKDTPDASRRRFMVAGIAAAPLLVTLAARPASAQPTNGSLGNYASTTTTP